MLQACKSCGIGFDLDFVARNPFQRCPNPACKAPLDADAVEHTFAEALIPSNLKDPLRLDLRAQLHNDVAAHAGTDTTTTNEKLAAGMVRKDQPDRKILRATEADSTAHPFAKVNLFAKPANASPGFAAFNR